MEKLMNRNSAVSKVTSCVISVLLVVSMMVIPAYGSDLLVAADMDIAADANQQNGTISTPDAASLEDQQSTCRDEDGIGPAESGTENLETDNPEPEGTVTEESGEELPGPPLYYEEEENNEDESGTSETTEPDEEETTPVITADQITTELTASYDSATRLINCKFTITNNSDYGVDTVRFNAYFSAVPDLCQKIVGVAYDEYTVNDEFSLEAHGSRNIEFSIEVESDVQLDGIDPTVTVNGVAMVGDGANSFEVIASSSVQVEEAVSTISLECAYERVICDAAGNPTGSDGTAVPGNIVKITYTITNTGSEDLTDVAFGSEEPLVLLNYSGDRQDIAAKESVTIEAEYPVTDTDIDGQSGSVVAVLQATVGTTTLEFPYDMCKVGTEFEYSIRYIYDSVDYGVGAVFMAELDSEPVLQDYEINVYMPDELRRVLPANGISVSCSPLTITSNPENNIIYVVYSTIQYPYTVNYYVDSTDNDPIASYEFKAAYGTDITLNNELLNQHKPDGYLPLTVSPVLLVTDNADSNVLNIVYSEKEIIGYTIRYFKDSKESEPLAAVPGTAPYGSDLVMEASADYGQLNYALPAGYAPFTESYTHQIKATASENMIDVIYVKKNSYPLTINYYFDTNEGEPEYTLTTEKTFEFGSAVPLGEDVLNKYVNERDGYEPKTPYVHTVNTTNIINVVYSKQKDIAYTINYYAGEISDATRLGDPIIGRAAYGENVTPANINERKPVGHDDAEVDAFIVSTNPDENEFSVVYPRKIFAYTIQYRTDGFNLDGTHRYTEIEGSESIGYEQYGTTIVISADILNAFLPKGYQAKTDADQMNLVVTADENSNTILVTYSPLPMQYTVRYYADNTNGAPIATDVFDGSWYGSALRINQSVLNRHVPAGYSPVSEYVRVIESLDYTNNTIDVVYNKQTNIPYAIEYYLGSTSGSPYYTVRGQGTLDDRIPYVIPEDQPEGYDFDNPIYTSTTITPNQQNNVLRVVYKPNDYDYTVNYYKDSIEENNWLGSKGGTATFGSEIAHEKGAFLPEGYDADKVNVYGSRFISIQADANVKNVVYTTKAQIQYIVNYYGGSISGNPLKSVEGAAELGTTIPYDISSIEHPGYEGTPSISGARTVGANAAANILNVVIPTGTYNYTINYYRDQVDSKNLLGSDTGSGSYMSRIEGRQGAFVPTGYSYSGRVVGASTITPDEESNVFNVVYSPNSYNYTVRYYRDSADPANYLGSETPGQGVFGSAVSIPTSVLNARLPQGYAPIAETASVRITENPAANVLNVVYESADVANAASNNQDDSPLAAFVGGVQDAFAAIVDFFTPDEPEEITDEENPLANAEGQVTDITDDGNPLTSISSDLSGSETTTSSNFMMNIVLLIVACGSALGSGISLLFRKSVRDAFAGLSKKDLAYGEEKARTLTHRAVAFATLSLVFFAILIAMQM